MTTTPHTTDVVIIGAGQSGLAAAGALGAAGVRPVVLEAAAEPHGSWPHYYDSLKAFSSNRFNAMPGLPFGGDPDDHPTRDEVAEYLRRYAAGLDAEIRTGVRVTEVGHDGGRFVVHTAGGDTLEAGAVVAATGSFGNPYTPELPGAAAYRGIVRHVADYRNPAPYAGSRVVVVGGGNSAVQVACELAQVATVTVASTEPLTLVPHRPGGRDVHHVLTVAVDPLPAPWVALLFDGAPVLDIGGYAEAFAAGRPDRRDMFTTFTEDGVRWSDGTTEPVDAVITATGYRPDLGYLRALGALDATGAPLHSGGLSTTHAGLAYLGLEFQRSFASNTLRGVFADAAAIAPAVAAVARGGHRLLG
ncbi:putative flavoprotein involved in K+ transport [Stackebrandtia albiflava]|uniref:Putative flavoprotein involved in K+ transport n=1 Tax=Stackebrandtia albiflava TaxID=406432 RepID=A0A562V9E8_9ACTN|nr:NAD(P)/FAD-dependent oxidoreductase [Stackebrandtia albiflava]TWJ14500.1 putative flavoprotein involved in K+ transport [Stackebrandtia albiflava]